MVTISTKPSGGFGNRLFTYNFCMQLSYEIGQEFRIKPNGDEAFFPEIFRETPFTILPYKLTSEKFNKLNKKLFFEKLKKKKIIELQGAFLGDYFFKFDRLDPKSLFTFSEPEKHSQPEIALHFRGGDFFGWNSRAVLDPEYYINALEKIGKKTVGIYTDDWKLDSIKIVVHWLYENKIPFYESKNSNMWNDFRSLSNADYLVSCPSTFGIWAGILGKKKKIIHSKKWLDHACENNDTFWLNLREGGNEYYSIDMEC